MPLAQAGIGGSTPSERHPHSGGALWQFDHLVSRLVMDDLLDAKLGTDPEDRNMASMLLSASDEILCNRLRMDLSDDDEPDKRGRYPGLPFSTTSQLGARYIGFLADDPVWPPGTTLIDLGRRDV